MDVRLNFASEYYKQKKITFQANNLNDFFENIKTLFLVRYSGTFLPNTKQTRIFPKHLASSDFTIYDSQY